jgi:hypothetical protein
MKKFVFVLCAAAIVAGAVSCKKEKIEPIENPVPVYAEGIYHPVMHIATVSEDGVVTQEWNWVGDNLDKIATPDGGATTYSYSGNYISKVSNVGEQAEELRYYYDESHKFTKCEVYYNGMQAITMNLTHNAAGKVSGAEVLVEDSFLLSLASGLLGGGSLFENLVGRKAAESMIMMAKLQHAKAPKFTMGNKEFGMTLEWNGENLSKQIITGNASVVLDTNDLNLLRMFIDIPEEYSGIIQMVMMLQGGLPISLTIGDTISCTYDTNYNPFFCNWGEIFSHRNLSLNNALSMTNNGSVAISASLMGQAMELYNYPLNEYAEYQYQYNDKRYPTKASGETEIEYTYKQ